MLRSWLLVFLPVILVRAALPYHYEAVRKSAFAFEKLATGATLRFSAFNEDLVFELEEVTSLFAPGARVTTLNGDKVTSDMPLSHYNIQTFKGSDELSRFTILHDGSIAGWYLHQSTAYLVRV